MYTNHKDTQKGSINLFQAYSQKIYNKNNGLNSQPSNNIAASSTNSKTINPHFAQVPIVSSGSYLQLSKQNKKGSQMKSSNYNTVGSQQSKVQQQQSKLRQSTNSQIQNLQQINQQPTNDFETNNLNRVRSMSPTGTIVQIVNSEQKPQHPITLVSGNVGCSPTTIFQQQMLLNSSSQIKLLNSPTNSIQQINPTTISCNQSIQNFQNQKEFIKNQNDVNTFYEEIPLQSSLFKEDVISPQFQKIQENFQHHAQFVVIPNQQNSTTNQNEQNSTTKITQNFRDDKDEESEKVKKTILQQLSKQYSIPTSEILTANTSNLYDEIFVRENDSMNKKIDQIFDNAEVIKEHHKDNELHSYTLIKNFESPSIQEEQIQQYLHINQQQKQQIELLQNQELEKDNQIQSNLQRISQLESDLINYNSKYQELSDQIQKLVFENQSLREQMEMEVENQKQNIPTHIAQEIDILRSNIHLFEQEVQKVIMSEQSVRQQLELERISKQNLEHLIEELKYQLQKSLENTESHSSGANKDEIINCLLAEVKKITTENENLIAELEKQRKDTQQYKDCMLKTTICYEKELKQLKDERNHFEKQHKSADDKYNKKHSVILAENTYVLTQLTFMKQEIEDKTKEVEKLKEKLKQKGQSTEDHTSHQCDNEIQQLALNYQALLENEHNKFKESCQTYELEISHYKQQIQSLIDKGSENIICDQTVNLKNQIANLENINEQNEQTIQMLSNQNALLEEEFYQLKKFLAQKEHNLAENQANINQV